MGLRDSSGTGSPLGLPICESITNDLGLYFKISIIVGIVALILLGSLIWPYFIGTLKSALKSTSELEFNDLVRCFRVAFESI